MNRTLYDPPKEEINDLVSLSNEKKVPDERDRTRMKSVIVQWASECGKGDIVKALWRYPELLEFGVDEGGYIGIHRAAERGDLMLVRAMTSPQDVRPSNIRMFNGDTPLLCAARGGHDDVVRFLLSRGADINICNKLGSLPLLVAAKHNHL